MIRLGQMSEVDKNDILAVQSELGAMRGDLGNIVTKVNEDFVALSDTLQTKQVAALEGMNRVVSEARVTFNEQQSKLDVHHRTFVEEHQKFETLQNDVRELHKRTETSVVELQTWVRHVEAKVDQGGGGPGGSADPSEVSRIQYDLRDLYQKSESCIVELQKRCQELEARAGGGDGGRGGKGHPRGYLPQKHLIPDPFDSKMDDWRQWLDDLLGYLENCNPGMKAFLKSLAGRDDPPDEFWYQQQSRLFPEAVTKDGAEIFRTLKALTAGEARKIITSVDSDNGFMAFWKLVRHNNPYLAELQGTALARLTQMGLARASTPTETKHKVTEMEVNIKYAEAVIGEGLNDLHLKSIILGFIDPLTRAHTVAHQASDVLFETFKRHVLAFCNGNIGHGGGAVPMAIGAVAATTPEAEPEASPTGDWGYWSPSASSEWEEYLNAVGKGDPRTCFQCGKPGHLARECPQKGKGGGKGKGKFGGKGFDKGKGKFGGGGFDKGKGKGKGPKGGCYDCGGDHYARDCPKAKLYSMGIPQEYIERLSCLTEVTDEKEEHAEVQTATDETAESREPWVSLLMSLPAKLQEEIHAKNQRDQEHKEYLDYIEAVMNKHINEMKDLSRCMNSSFCASTDSTTSTTGRDEPYSACRSKAQINAGNKDLHTLPHEKAHTHKQCAAGETDELEWKIPKKVAKRTSCTTSSCSGSCSRTWRREANGFWTAYPREWIVTDYDEDIETETEASSTSGSTGTAGVCSPDLKAADAGVCSPGTWENPSVSTGPWIYLAEEAAKFSAERWRREEDREWEAYKAAFKQHDENELFKKRDLEKEDNFQQRASTLLKRMRDKQELRFLEEIVPEGLNSAAETEEWEKIDLYVDSGATETVISSEMVSSVEAREGKAQKMGVKYEVANGVRIPNLGEKEFVGVSEEGLVKTVTAQVCAVNKALLSVKKVTKSGNRVVFDEDGSYVENKQTGERMWLEEKNGMYVLSMWVKKAGF